MTTPTPGADKATEELPPLPRAEHSYQASSDSEFSASWNSAYTADQMRDYARAALANRQAPTNPKQVGWLNVKYQTFFKLSELAATDRATEMLTSGEIIRVYSGQAPTEAVNPWRTLFGQVAFTLNCLPSSFADGNDHVLKKAEEFAARQVGAPDDARDADLATVRDLDAISMALGARLVQMHTDTIKGHDYLLRDGVMREVVEWRSAWDRNSANRKPVHRAAIAQEQAS